MRRPEQKIKRKIKNPKIPVSRNFVETGYDPEKDPVLNSQVCPFDESKLITDCEEINYIRDQIYEKCTYYWDSARKNGCFDDTGDPDTCNYLLETIGMSRQCAYNGDISTLSWMYDGWCKEGYPPRACDLRDYDINIYGFSKIYDDPHDRR